MLIWDSSSNHVRVRKRRARLTFVHFLQASTLLNVYYVHTGRTCTRVQSCLQLQLIWGWGAGNQCRMSNTIMYVYVCEKEKAV